MTASEIIEGRLYIGDCQDGRLAHEDPYDYDEVIALASGDHDNTTETFYLPDGGPHFEKDEHYPVFRDAVNTLRRHMLDGRSVLVHCNVGQSRAPSVSIAAIATLDGSSYNEAFNEVKEKRAIANPGAQLRACAQKYINTYQIHHDR